jgi:hypothetical protein
MLASPINAVFKKLIRIPVLGISNQNLPDFQTRTYWIQPEFPGLEKPEFTRLSNQNLLDSAGISWIGKPELTGFDQKELETDDIQQSNSSPRILIPNNGSSNRSYVLHAHGPGILAGVVRFNPESGINLLCLGLLRP